MRTINTLKTLLLATVAVATVAGCAKYASKPLTPDAVERSLATPDGNSLRVAAADLHHPTLKPLPLDPTAALSPDQIAVLAVLVHPDLRAERTRRDAAAAQVIQAGILPNPVLTGGMDFPYSTPPPDNHTAYNVGVNWDVTSLITRDAKRRAATDAAASVDLDIAWREWQVAESAKVAAYDVLATEAQLIPAREAERHLTQNLHVVRHAVERHQRTLIDLPAAESAARDAHTAVLTLETDLRRQRLALNRAVGLPPDVPLALRPEPSLAAALTPPSTGDLLADIDSHRLDLLALKKGYDSQEATLRAAILGQFPKINFGVSNASDTTGVTTVGFGVGVDLPVFDRNQGVIAAETATRQRLFDEYAGRLFAARADIAAAAEDIRITDDLIADTDAAIPNLERLVRTYETALRRGNADVLSYYNAVGALDQKRIAAVKLRQQLIQNWVALELASGRYLPLGPATPTTAPATTQESKP